MKIKSLLLGSLAIAGMSGLATGAQAADLAKGVMTSLDVCDALGLSGLTISSDTDCLQITGGVSYMFSWGDYKAGQGTAAGGLGLIMTPTQNPFRIPQPGNDVAAGTGLGGVTADWDSQMTAWLQVVGTADSDFGPAKVVIHMKSEQYRHSANGFGWFDGGDTGGATTNVGLGEYNAAGAPHASGIGPSGTVVFDQAYVSVGDSTVLTAGLTGTVADVDDDTPLNYLGLFNSDGVGTGVLWSVKNQSGGSTYGDYTKVGAPLTDTSGADVHLGGESIQLTSSLGNGVTLKGGLEDINDTNNSRAGTAVGVISYAGDNITAHLTLIEAGILDGHPDVTAWHAGFTGTFDKVSIVGAIAGDSTGYYDGLVSAQLGLDMFKLAASGEFLHYSSDASNTATLPGPGGAGSVAAAGKNAWGGGLSATMALSDGVSLNLGGRYFDADTSTSANEGYQIAASIVAAVTETITLTGEVGVYGTDGVIMTETPGTAGPASLGATPLNGKTATIGSPVTAGSWYDVWYGAGQVSWAPGGGFTSSLRGAAYSNGAYQLTFNAAKNFQ
jgi:hypothetical protein